MRTGGEIFRFGPYEFDSAQRRLKRGDERIHARPSSIDLLTQFVTRPGEVISYDALAESVWAQTEVEDNTVAQGVSRLGKRLGKQPDGSPFIVNVPGRGYRFTAAVTREQPPRTHVAAGDLIARHQALVLRRAGLETLSCDAIAAALPDYEEAVKVAPLYAPGHVGLAAVCHLLYESTRIDITPNFAALERATRAAHTACELDPESADAWGTLALVHYSNRDAVAAIAAARVAISLETWEWSHQLRLAFVSWGRDRLRAAQRASSMYRELAWPHWFTGTVLIGRRLLDDAEKELRVGCATHDTQRRQTNRFNAVGLHLLLGLVLAARGALDEALAQFACELAGLNAGHVYARECGAYTCYAIGAVRLRQGCRETAAEAFREALARVPGHPAATVGLAFVSGVLPSIDPRPHAHPVDVALVKAMWLALQGRQDEAARLCAEALLRSEPGSAGWMMGIDPLIHATGHEDAWADTLAILQHRAG